MVAMGKTFLLSAVCAGCVGSGYNVVVLAKPEPKLVFEPIIEAAQPLDGVWATQDNQVYVFGRKRGYFMLEAGAMFGSLDFDRTPPDGSIWYAWATGPRPEFVGRKRQSLPILGAPGEYKLSGGSINKIIRPSNQSTQGWFMYWPASPTSTYGELVVENGPKNRTQRTRLSQIAPSVDNVWFDGTYKDHAVTVSAKFIEGYVRGTMTYAGKSAIFEGQFGEASAFFRLVDQRTGEQVGDGYVQWAPTKEFVAEMRKGKIEPSDRILVWFMLRDRSVPSGYKALLTRTPNGSD